MRNPASIALLCTATAVLGFGAAFRGGEAALGQQTPAAAALRIATVDVYTIVDKVMQSPDAKKAQEDLKSKWEPRLEALQNDLRKIEADLQALPQSDPRVQDVMKSGRDKQAEYDKAAQDYESLNARQLVDAYTLVRDSANRLASARGYTHVLVNRPPERPIETKNLGNTLQEFFARPLIKSPAGDDLTRDVASELKVEL
jgi:Skp family chaperone for outer membrane proteins